MELSQNTRALTDIDKQFQSFFDSLPQLGWTAQPDGVVDFYNSEFYAYTGFTFEELYGSGWSKVVDEKDYPHVLERWKNSLATFANFEMKVPLRRHDGIYRLFLTRATPVFNDDGTCVRWIGVNTDIQDEIDRSTELARSEQQFRLLADSLPDLVWISDCNLSFRYLNQRWIDYTSLPISDGLGDGWRQVVCPDDLARAAQVWQISSTSNQPFESELRLRGGGWSLSLVSSTGHSGE